MAVVINGSGTVTGLAVGGLPDGIVDAGTVAADVATQAELDAASFDPDGAVTINDSGADVNFRIESNSNANQLFVDGGNGRVGIGTGSPDKELELQKDHNGQTTMQIQNDTAGTGAMAQLRVRTNSSLGILASIDDGYSSAGIYQAGTISLIAADNSTGGLVLGTEGNHPVLFYQGASEAMRIKSSGNVCINTDETDGNIGGSSGDSTWTFNVNDGMRIGHTGASYWNRFNSGALCNFRRGGTTVGAISVSSSATSFDTSSDYRLKEDVKPMSASIDKLKELKPVNFAWKVDGSRVDGFLAHEAQEVVPNAITGEKDAVDDDGNAVYQGIDQSKLVPLLTSALQEAVAKIEELTTRIEILENA